MILETEIRFECFLNLIGEELLVIAGGSSQKKTALDSLYSLNIETWKITKVHTYVLTNVHTYLYMYAFIICDRI